MKPPFCLLSRSSGPSLAPTGDDLFVALLCRTTKNGEKRTSLSGLFLWPRQVAESPRVSACHETGGGHGGRGWVQSHAEVRRSRSRRTTASCSSLVSRLCRQDLIASSTMRSSACMHRPRLQQVSGSCTYSTIVCRYCVHMVEKHQPVGEILWLGPLCQARASQQARREAHLPNTIGIAPSVLQQQQMLESQHYQQSRE